MTWQPIATAPKDGRTLLLWSRNGGYVIGQWFETGRDGWWVAHAMQITPTHWMPLPAAPTEAPEPAPPQAPPKDHARVLVEAARRAVQKLREGMPYASQHRVDGIRNTAELCESVIADYERDASEPRGVAE